VLLCKVCAVQVRRHDSLSSLVVQIHRELVLRVFGIRTAKLSSTVVRRVAVDS
jgi:hypothetical protein